MHSLSIILSGAALLTAAFALPTEIAPRACQTIYPSYISWIDSRSPNGAQGATNIISTFANPPNGPFRVAEVQFTVPAGAGGPCSLLYDFPAGAAISASGHSQLQVYKTSSNITPNDSWGHSPNPTFLFGSFNPVAGTSGTINSEGCATTLNYFVQVFEQWQLTSGSTVQGSVEFTQVSQPPPAELGLKLTYGC